MKSIFFNNNIILYLYVVGGREEQAGEPAEEQPDEAEGADPG